MIEAIDNNKSSPQISILDAMKMLVLAWDEVTDKTIQNCFKKAGFTEISDDSLSSDDPFSALKDTVCQLSRMDESLKDISVEDIASFDNSLPVTQALMSDEDILTEIWETILKMETRMRRKKPLSWSNQPRLNYAEP